LQAFSRPHRCSKIRIKFRNENEQEIHYRSIGEVVGGLHGGKYQSSTGGSYGEFVFVGNPSANHIQEQEDIDNEEEVPNWAQNMHFPVETGRKSIAASNSYRKDGMLRAATVTIKNDK